MYFTQIYAHRKGGAPITNNVTIEIQWVTDLIQDDYKNWDGKKVFLECGTGRGKTTFALGVYSKFLLEHNKKVLYLCNRVALQNQILDNLSLYGVSEVEVKTYQKLAEEIEVMPLKDMMYISVMKYTFF